MTKMLLHCGANETTIGDVVAVQTPPATLSHYPVSHEEFLMQTLEVLDEYGYTPNKVTHALGGIDCARYFGTLDIKHEANDHGLIVGVRNSHDKSFSAGLVAGSRVFVCDNLAFSGEVSLGRKHTRHIVRDLPRLMGRMIAAMTRFLTKQEGQIESYKATELNDCSARALMVEGVKRGMIPCTQLPAVLKEWEQPSHEDFAPRTVWSWFNAVTECAKTWGVQQQVKRTQLLHAVCDHHALAS